MHLCTEISQKSVLRRERREFGEILRTLCMWKKVKIVEAEVSADHVHMLLENPPKVSVSSFMGCLKRKSSLMIYEKYPEWKSSIEIGSSSAEDTMWIQLERMQRK